MLDTLTIENSFAHKNLVIDFKQGFTAITGKNGSGKSEVLDCIRFALFGSEALRTPVGDYKALRVSLAASIKGVPYLIARSTTQAKITSGAAVLAVGTRPVNAKIIEIFGYNLKVFDTANAVRQNKIAAMSEMLPAERKRMVDTVIGLDVIDNLIKWCGDESKLKATEANGARYGLIEPVEPIMPEGYMGQDDLAAMAARQGELSNRAHTLRGLIAGEPKVTPKPTEPLGGQSADDLRTLINYRQSVAMQISTGETELKKFGAPPVYTAEQLDAFEAQNELSVLVREAVRELSSPIAPAYNLEQLDQFENMIHAHDYWAEYHRLAKKGDTTCPSCQHKWYNAHEDMARCGDWKDKPEPPRPPVNTLLGIQQMRNAWEVIEGRLPERARAEVIVCAHGREVSASPLNNQMLANERRALATDAMRQGWQVATDKLRAEMARLPDVRNELTARVTYDRLLDIHTREAEAHAVWAAACPAWQAELDELVDLPRVMEQTAVLRAACASYDALSAAHAGHVATYNTTLERIASLTQEAEQFARARAGLTAVKARVKTHLVPSLSKVATILLRQMTGGLMNDVTITNEFDITVDGKIMDALSGAEMAAANLAIRIGLGQVLTNRVFSVLMADEVDKDMDAERAPFMAACLRNLTTTISQVILVSHKNPEADNIIAL